MSADPTSGLHRRALELQVRPEQAGSKNDMHGGMSLLVSPQPERVGHASVRAIFDPETATTRDQAMTPAKKPRARDGELLATTAMEISCLAV